MIVKWIQKIVVSSGREVVGIVYGDNLDEFFVAGRGRYVSGPFKMNDSRFQDKTPA